MADNPFSVVEAAQNLAAREGNVEQAIEKASAQGSPSQPAAPQPGGTTLDQAMRTAHTGSQGEKAYGTPMDTSAPLSRSAPTPQVDSQSRAEMIRQAQEQRIAELNELAANSNRRSAQNTDDAN